MKDTSSRTVLFFICVILIAVIGGFTIGYNTSKNIWREEVIQRGAAKWSIDPKTGVKFLEWKEGC